MNELGVSLVKAVASVQEFADDYLKTVELDGILSEDEEGREGYCHPNEKELWLITDTVNGLIADEDFLRLCRDEVIAREKERAAAGQCILCGRNLPGHWGGCKADAVTVISTEGE